MTSIASLVELLNVRAELGRGGYTYLQDGDPESYRLTFAELDRRARDLGARLRARGQAGRPVLILCPPGLDYIVAFMGCLAGGALATPAYPPDPTRLARTLPRLRAITADIEAEVIVTTTPILSMSAAVAAEAPELAALDWIAADVDGGAADDWSAPEVGRDDVAMLQYTSGSTAAPKGVMLTHGNLLHNLELIQSFFGETEETHGVSWLPPYHDMGLIGAILEPLYLGAELTLLSPLDFLRRPMWWLEVISRTKAHTSGGPNFAYDLCVKKSRPEERAALDLSNWALAFNAAEPVRPATLDRFVEAFGPAGFSKDAFYTCYGLAEATLIVTGGRRGEHPTRATFEGTALDAGRAVPTEASAEGARTLVDLGRAPPDQSVMIVDRKTRAPLPERAVGEIWVGGPSVAAGYWKNEAGTRKAFAGQIAGLSGPYLRTGDLGFLADGRLYFASREKDLIVIRGRNHYPHDIEEVVELAHPALRPGCGAAFGVDTKDRETLVVVWEVTPGRAGDLNEVLGAIRRAISRDLPVSAGAIVLIEPKSLPKTSSGKVQRRQCREEYLAKTLPILAEWTPLAEREAAEGLPVIDWLVDRIAARAGLTADEIDPRAPMIDHGLDSEGAVELAAHLSERIGIQLSATLVFDHPTIEDLARHIDELAGRAA